MAAPVRQLRSGLAAGPAASVQEVAQLAAAAIAARDAELDEVVLAVPTAHVQGRVARAIDGTQLSRACPADRPFNREALCWVELLRDGGTAYEQRILERRVQRRARERLVASDGMVMPHSLAARRPRRLRPVPLEPGRR